MILMKMNNRNQLNGFKAIVNGIKIDDSNLRRLAEKQIEIDNNKKEQKEIISRLRIQNKKLLEQLAGLKKKLKENSLEQVQIINNVNDMKKLNNSLSAALGSCSHCWGEDPDCSVCSGDGISGWRNINKRMFNIHVLPCLEKLYSLN